MQIQPNNKELISYYSFPYFFINTSVMDWHAEPVVLHLCSSYLLCFLHEQFIDLIRMNQYSSLACMKW
jgi:hypothetical protein